MNWTNKGHKMRKLALLAILALMLLLAACSTITGDSVGVVNGKRIPYDEYIASYRSHYENFYTQNGRPPDLEEKRLLEQQTWLNITKYVILQDYYRRYRISVTHEEVLDSLSTNPPEYIRNSPWFQVNGSFDQSSYLQSLNFDSPRNLRPVRKHYFDNVIPILKLKEALIDNEFLTRTERENVSRILKGKASIDWLVFDSNAQNIRIADNEIESYYNANLQNYLNEPYYSFSYTMLPALVSEADLNYTLALQDTVVQHLSEGSSLESIISSSMGSREGLSVYDTGYLFIPDLPTELKNQINDLQPGQCSAPLRTPASIDLYRMEHMTRSMVKFTKLSIPIKARETSITQARRNAENLRQLSASIGFSNACDEMDLVPKRLERMLPGDPWLENPELEQQFLRSMTSAVAGSYLEPLFSTTQSAWIVVHLEEKQNNDPKALSTVRDEINSILVNSRKQELTVQQARIWLDQNQPLYNLPEQDPNMQVFSISDQNYGDSLNNLDVSNIYYKAVMAFQKRQTPQYYQLGDLILVPLVRSFTVEQASRSSYQDIRKAFVQSLEPNWFDLWMNEKVRIARVKTVSLKVTE